jgi:hypothetical protein
MAEPEYSLDDMLRLGAENSRLKARVAELEKQPIRIGDMENMEGYEMVHAREGVGSKGLSGVKIFVRFDRETKKAIAALDDDRNKHRPGFTPREDEDHIWSRVGDEVERIREEQALRLDPEVACRAVETKASFAKAFADAGLGPIFMEAVPNQYWPERDPYGKFDPWFKVATRIGYIKIGWRKRVINIDWSETTLRSKVKDEYDYYNKQPRRPGGTELFQFALDKNETTTVGDYFIHAYGYEKATEYLKVLASAQVPA